MDYKERTIDYQFGKLCDQVDQWKAEAEYWKAQYDEEIQRSIKESNESLIDAKKGVANALMFALSAKDDENGNLVIGKEDRNILAENLK